MSANKQRVCSTYDRERDVLYVSFGPPRAGYAEPDEEFDNILLRYDDEDMLMGFTIIGFAKMDAELVQRRLNQLLPEPFDLREAW